MSRRFSAQDATGILIEVPGQGVALSYGTSKPTDDDSGYMVGALFMKTDGGDGSALYVNEGTTSACDFNLVTVAAA